MTPAALDPVITDAPLSTDPTPVGASDTARVSSAALATAAAISLPSVEAAMAAADVTGEEEQGGGAGSEEQGGGDDDDDGAAEEVANAPTIAEPPTPSPRGDGPVGALHDDSLAAAGGVDAGAGAGGDASASEAEERYAADDDADAAAAAAAAPPSSGVEERYSVQKIHKVRGKIPRTLVLDASGDHFWTEKTGKSGKGKVTNSWEFAHNFVSARVQSGDAEGERWNPCRMELIVAHGLRQLDPLRLNLGRKVKDVRRKRAVSARVEIVSAGFEAVGDRRGAGGRRKMSKAKSLFLKGKSTREVAAECDGSGAKRSPPTSKLKAAHIKLSNGVREKIVFEMFTAAECTTAVAQLRARAVLARQ
jgi:hypothetical protein